MANIKVYQLINDNNNPAANQFVIETPKATFFQSYDSVIARYDNDTHKIELGPDWDFSNTTRKHLYIFLRDKTRFSVHSKKDVLKLIEDGDFKEVCEIKY